MSTHDQLGSCPACTCTVSQRPGSTHHGAMRRSVGGSRAVAARVTSQERIAGDSSMGADVEVGQGMGAQAAFAAVAHERSRRKERGIPRQRRPA